MSDLSTPSQAGKSVVSVIIGTKDRPDTLRRALESIRALEGPDLTFQICIGDNGSTPETRAVAEEFHAVYDTTGEYGCPAARNLAMKRATGDYIAFLDDDDAWLADHIRPHIKMFQEKPGLDAVFSQYIFTDPDLTPTSAQPSRRSRRRTEISFAPCSAAISPRWDRACSAATPSSAMA